MKSNLFKKIYAWFKSLSKIKKIASSIIILIIIPILVNVVSHRVNKWNDSLDSENITNEQDIQPRPIFKLSNYYIKVENTTYPDLDTIVLKYKEIESVNLDLRGITLIKSHIDDDINLYSGHDASPFSISLIDSYVKNDSIFLELNRKMIFDGFRAAWFEQEDKHQIGELTFRIPYYIDNKIFSDTLTNSIYLIK
jgi:hypothetical protein